VLEGDKNGRYLSVAKASPENDPFKDFLYLFDQYLWCQSKTIILDVAG
jgi:hypothetical protein